MEVMFAERCEYTESHCVPRSVFAESYGSSTCNFFLGATILFSPVVGACVAACMALLLG